MKRICTEEENNLIRGCVSDILTFSNLFSQAGCVCGKQFWVNGGVVLNYMNTGSGDRAWLTIAEDDLRDEMGNLCCVRYFAPFGLDIAVGERIMLVYSDEGAYIPMRVTEKTQHLIPVEKPEYFDSVDWDKTVKLPHPNILELDKTPYPMNEQEIEKFAETGAEFFPKLVRSIKKKQLKKVRYKKKVLLIHSDVISNGRVNGVKIKTPQMRVYEYVNGNIKESCYITQNADFLPENVVYGKVICKYTVKEKVGEFGLNLFGVDNETC